MDGGDSDAERHDVFIGTVLTLQRIDCAQQTFMVTGYVNAMWHCSDLEKEVSRQDYYGPENSLTVKDGLQLARKQKAGEQLKGEDEKRAVPGYIRSSVADDKEERHFVTGFTLSHESDVLPFNPSKMFEDRRIVPETFEREEETYYYYPEDENEGKVGAHGDITSSLPSCLRLLPTTRATAAARTKGSLRWCSYRRSARG